MRGLTWGMNHRGAARRPRGLCERYAQLKLKQLVQLAYDGLRGSHDSGTLALDIHLHVAAYLVHQHLALRDLVKPISQIGHHKARHHIELGRGEIHRLQDASLPLPTHLCAAGGNELEAHLLYHASARSVRRGRQRRWWRGQRWGWARWWWQWWWW